MLNILLWAYASFMAYTLNFNIYRVHRSLKSVRWYEGIPLISPLIFGIFAEIYLPYFSNTYFLGVIAITSLFLWYAFNYAIGYYWRIWFFLVKIKRIPEERYTPTKNSLLFCFKELSMFWSWSGWSKEKQQKLLNWDETRMKEMKGCDK